MMGANVELDIFFYQGGFSLSDIFSLLKMEGLLIRIQNMRIFDDWKYTNELKIDMNMIDSLFNDKSLNKFTLIHFTVNNKWSCVLITSIVEDAYVNYYFGIDIDNLALYTSEIEKEKFDADKYIPLLYENIIDFINHNSNTIPFKDLFIGACMGIEYSVSFNQDIMTMFNDDNSVVKWILPVNIGRKIVSKKFLKEEKSNTVVFTKIW